jgi:hypothetical protein
VMKKKRIEAEWRILVPCTFNDGTDIAVEHHREWDRRVQRIAGGLTIHKPSKGRWTSPDGDEYAEGMIPVFIACSEEQIDEIARMTVEHYDQIAVLVARTSETVFLYERD